MKDGGGGGGGRVSWGGGGKGGICGCGKGGHLVAFFDENMTYCCGRMSSKSRVTRHVSPVDSVVILLISTT